MLRLLLLLLLLPAVAPGLEPLREDFFAFFAALRRWLAAERVSPHSPPSAALTPSVMDAAGWPREDREAAATLALSRAGGTAGGAVAAAGRGKEGEEGEAPLLLLPPLLPPLLLPPLLPPLA